MNATYLSKILLKRLQASHVKFYIYIQSEWLEDSTCLTMLDALTHRCYFGRAKQSEFEEAANELEIPLSQLRNECKAVLTTTDGLVGFEVELDQDEKILRINKNEQFLVQYLEIRLNEIENNYELLDTALKLVDAKKYESENLKANQYFKEVVDRLNIFIKEKEKIKENILKRCANLLYTKKKMIVELKNMPPLSDICRTDVNTYNNDDDRSKDNQGDQRTGIAKKCHPTSLPKENISDEILIPKTQAIFENYCDEIAEKRPKFAQTLSSDD